MMRRRGAFWRDDGGATAIEYGLLAGLIAVALIATMVVLGNSVVELFDNGAANTIAEQTAQIP